MYLLVSLAGGICEETVQASQVAATSGKKLNYYLYFDQFYKTLNNIYYVIFF